MVEPVREEPGDAALGALGVIGAARAGLDARLIEAARVVVATTGQALLAGKGFTSVDELTDARRRAWRAEAKRAACAEIEATLGLGVTETRQLVGIACAPVDVRAPVLAALDTGEITWGMVRDFWRRCAGLTSDDAALVAESLFGTDPATAAPERLTPDDALRGTPWPAADYKAALEREAVRAEGVDVQAERERRRAAYQSRRASMVVEDDGTATLTVTGPLIAMVAAHTRIERAARLLRKQGDTRTLDQLRADIASALLVHGDLPLPGARPAPATGTPATNNDAATNADAAAAETDADATLAWRELQTPDLEHIARVVTGMPTVQLQVIVPWDALTGTPACVHTHDRTARGAIDPPPRRDVAQLLGHHSAYLTPGHLRELALLPGTTVTRLLTDPADGRLIERTQATYRPDADMRRQVLAADVHSRAPGTRHPASGCELDHVIPWAGAPDPAGGPPTGGPTAETNLVALDKRHHQLKTLGLATASINQLRDLTWTTLLGHTTTTRSHDHRQYTRPQPDAAPRPGTPPDRGAPAAAQAPLDPATQRDLINHALYAALSDRGPDAFLTDEDDHPGTGDHGGPLSRWMFITPTRARQTSRPTVDIDDRDAHEPERGSQHVDTDDRDTRRAWDDRRDQPPPF
ncbi:HNH endonuclease signature motif containing protein [Serinicoccus kebangsaanensis]|uniref:HNH endonuclease signature motif containing protein n=1 Tax=Serinicoccus kebangsaanensis TaxID=2602069 RepID=UPI00124E7B00|nr:HNH endonuclease signature motif containing protein [Serinicoccus kebangsaanensis]